MDRLKRLCDRSVAAMGYVHNFAKTMNQNTSIYSIEKQLERLESHFKSFNEYELELLAFSEYVPVTEEAEKTYVETKSKLQQAIGAHRKPPQANEDLNTTLEAFIGQQKSFYEGMGSKRVHLPKVQIEPFSGDYNSCPAFNDLYLATIHNDETLSNVHKLQLLKSLIRGDAAALIGHMSITEGNYLIAWEKLVKRYNKPKQILGFLIQTFLTQNRIVQINGKELRKLTERAEEVINSIKMLGVQAQERDPWLIYIITSKLDPDTRERWASHTTDTQFPDFDELISFLNNRFDALESCEVNVKKAPQSLTQSRTFLLPQLGDRTHNCVVCQQNHLIYQCPTFLNMNPMNRMSFAIKNNLCHNCLRQGHYRGRCFSRGRCQTCSQNHHSLLHTVSTSSNKSLSSANNRTSSTMSNHIYVNNDDDINETIPIPDTTVINANSTINQREMEPKSNCNTDTSAGRTSTLTYTTAASCGGQQSITTILPTALVLIKSHNEQYHLVRALLDSGSQTSFITESCIQRLGLKRTHSRVDVVGLAGVSAGTTRGETIINLKSRYDQNFTIHVAPRIINAISNALPTAIINVPEEHEIWSLELADPQFNKPSQVELLIGAEIFFEILMESQKQLQDVPVLQLTRFGWVIAGNMEASSTNQQIRCNLSTTNHDSQNSYALLRKFWEIEEVPEVGLDNYFEDECEKWYQKTTRIEWNGRFAIKLPFKDEHADLGESYSNAKRRLQAMERKFEKKPEFRKEYQSSMQDYIALGHMVKTTWDQLPIQNEDRYFLPHHAIIKESSSTTKLRVVFDASCKTSTGVALNEIIHAGPKPADIEKMYRQIKVETNDSNFQLILWRDNPNDEISVFKLTTLTYGTTCAPFMAVRTVKQIANNARELYPESAAIISDDFYMDDLLTGANTLIDAVRIRNEITNLLETHGFHLRKWKSNSNEFLQDFPKDQIRKEPKLIEQDESTKTLGIVWHSSSDTLSFQINKNQNIERWTKRNMLSEISKLYDPFGWLAPTTITCKILMQKLWLLNVDWDDALPSHITNQWQRIYARLAELQNIVIPRCLFAEQDTNLYMSIYGTVLYLRTVRMDGKISTNIVMAKSKVAPLSQTSIARLELCAAVVLAKLVKFITTVLSNQIEVFAWTDSKIVLSWLADTPTRWKPFVANRTATIIKIIPPAKWKYVSSKQNPADFASRGSRPEELSNLSIWWNGADWLSKPPDQWPVDTTVPKQPHEAIREQRSRSLNVLLMSQKVTNVADTTINSIDELIGSSSTTSMFNESKAIDKNKGKKLHYTEHTTNKREYCIIDDYLRKYSSFQRIKRGIAYLMMFKYHKERNKTKVRGLTCTELTAAEDIVIRYIQKTALAEDYHRLENQLSLSRSSALLPLDPFLDERGVIRVGGRLRNSSLPALKLKGSLRTA